MSKKLGCSTPLLIFGIVLLAMFVIAFMFGPLGAKILSLGGIEIEAPEWMAVEKPHIQLPSEGIIHLSWFTITNTLIASWLTIIVLFLFFYFATRKMQLIPGRLQNLAELIIESLLNLIRPVAEKNARILLPLFATIFLYVLVNAYMAFIPLFDGPIYLIEHNGAHAPLLRAANTDINVPLSIAIISFFYTEIQGLRIHGFFRYLDTFFQTGKLKEGFSQLIKGKVKPALSGLAFGFLNLFIGLLEVISHLVRLLSFTFSLFGNSDGRVDPSHGGNIPRPVYTVNSRLRFGDVFRCASGIYLRYADGGIRQHGNVFP
jgi:F-type H+-transporting ATPase subunit a